MKEYRPWGYYEILNETENHKSKYIYVESDQSLSYQRHEFRSEHWFIVSGYPSIVIDGEASVLSPGDSVDILAGSLHRISSKGAPIEFIEVQTGTYFGEDDIERLDDEYGRN
jgi:mannose-6-phosphate isomerase